MESNQQMTGSEHAAPHEVMQAGVGFDKQEPQVLLIAGFGVATIIGLFVLILGIQAYFNHVKDQQVNQQVLVPQADDYKQLKNTEEEALHNYKFIDRDKGVVQIPVDRAMALIAKEAADGKVQYFSQEYPVKVPNAAQPDGSGTGVNGGNSGTPVPAK